MPIDTITFIYKVYGVVDPRIVDKCDVSVLPDLKHVRPDICVAVETLLIFFVIRREGIILWTILAGIESACQVSHCISHF